MKPTPPLSPLTEIRLPDGRWVLAITYPQFDAKKKYRMRVPRRRRMVVA